MKENSNIETPLQGLLRTPLPAIEEVSLVLFELPLKAAFETSTGAIDHREIILSEIKAGGLRAYGECAADVDPHYSPETNYTAWMILKKYLVPLTGKCKTIQDYLDGSRPIRGHHMARATLEAALWDLLARSQGVPLFRLWKGTKEKIPCGVSVGLQKDNEILLRMIRNHLKEGYRRIKIKIKPKRDRDLLDAIRKEFPEVPLMADANAAYSLKDSDLLQSLDEFRLMMLEQPLHYEDLYDHAILQKQLQTPICLDESIISASRASAAIQMGSCRLINIKTGRVGGHTESIRIHDIAMQNDIPVWCGGMLESGVGRAHNLALVSLPNFKLPGDTSASNRYWHRDIIQPAVEIDHEGYVRLPEKPGFGFEVDHDYLNSLVTERFTTRFN